MEAVGTKSKKRIGEQSHEEHCNCDIFDRCDRIDARSAIELRRFAGQQIKADQERTWNERIDLQRNMNELNRSFPPVPQSVQEWKRNQYEIMLEQNREELNRLRERARQVNSFSGSGINR